MAILGGAFGFGLRRNVIALYKFACRNYRDADDELFGFGFSRGAFTIRIVMGLIDSQGSSRPTTRPNWTAWRVRPTAPIGGTATSI